MSKRKVEEGSGRRTDRAVLFAEMVGGERRAQIVARNDVQRQVLVEGSLSPRTSAICRWRLAVPRIGGRGRHGTGLSPG
ncbi:hypothetical protein UMZ34_17765 [Halopseudomonas pachastrellae]|nr:hypothetical protein UMZ34_17765 [Halopseudomonas pachastrellae]